MYRSSSRRDTANSARKTIFDWNNPKSTLVGPHNEEESLLRTIFRQRREGKRTRKGKTRGRLRLMLLDWIMKENYSRIKERAGEHGEWQSLMEELA